MKSTAPTNTMGVENKEGENKDMKTAAVLFIENTKDGLLAKKLREVVENIGALGY